MKFHILASQARKLKSLKKVLSSKLDIKPRDVAETMINRYVNDVYIKHGIDPR